MRIAAIVAWVGIAWAGPTVAQVPACRIEVWPAAGLETNSDGSWLIDAHNHALRDKDGHPSALANALTSAVQRAAIVEMDLPRLFAQPNMQVILHDGPMDPVAGIVQPPPCGGTLLLRHIIFSKTQMSKVALQGIFVWIPVTNGAAGRPFMTLVSTPLPNRWEDVDPANVPSVLSAALTQNIEQFARIVTTRATQH